MTVHTGIPLVRPALPFRTLVETRRVSAGVAIGLVGGGLLALPLVVYDWARAAHSALELPMAATGWLFGLEHFVQNEYRWWPIVIGAAFLALYCVLSGLVFAGIADRVLALSTWAGSIAAGLAWGVLSFMVFWTVLLPIARDGAPFRATTLSTTAVAPTWVWVLSFVLLGVGSGITFAAVHDEVTK